MDIQIILAIIISLIGFILTIKDLKLALIYLLALVPLAHKEEFSLVMWDVLPVRIAFIGIILASVYKLYKYNFKKALNWGYSNFHRDVVFITLFLLWLVRLVSLSFSKDLQSGVELLGFYTLIILLYVFLKVIYKLYGFSVFEKITKTYIYVGIATALFAFTQLYLRFCCRVKIGAVWVNPGHLPRLGSSFWDVNHYGGYLVTLIPISFAMFFASKTKKDKFIYLLASTFFTFALFLTGSRSSWLGLFFGALISVIVYWWAKVRKPLKILSSLIVIAMIAGIGFLSYSGISLRDQIASYMHYRLDSTDTHMLLVEGAGEVFVKNFLLGAGYGDFDTDFRKTKTAEVYFSREPALQKSKVPPHSIWGEVIAETGAVGIVLYSFLVIFIIAGLIVAIDKTKSLKNKYIGLGLFGGVVSVLLSGIFYSYNLEFFWVYLFISVGFTYLMLKGNWTLSNVIKWWYKKPITPYLILLPISIAFVFIKLGSTTLIDWDEAIYAKVAKNIILTGDWLNLHWDSLSEYWFEKPPLYMWLSAIAFKVTGFNSFGARFFSAFFGVLSILFTYLFSKKLYNKTVGVIASLILLSTVQFLYYSRNGMLDVTVTFFILSSIYLFYLGLSKIEEKNSRSYKIFFILSGMLVGLGVMTKAVIGLIPLPVLSLYVLYLWVSKKKLPLKISDGFFFIIPFLVVVTPWHLYSYLEHGDDFINTYFIDHMLGRGLAGFGHEKPVWWFFEVIKVSFRIWIFPLIGGVLSLFFIDKKNRDKFILTIISSFFILFLFSMSKDKLQWYIMPIYPFLAIISARFMERFAMLFNFSLKKPIQFDHYFVRVILVFLTFLTAAFYIVIMRGNIYYPDFNKDKIALVEIFNEKYPLEQYPEVKLYYNSISPPILLFYSDHDIKNIKDSDSAYDVIKEASPDQFNVFIMKHDLYYKVKEEIKRADFPVALEVKGSAGDWTLIKSNSRVEVLQSELAKLRMIEDAYLGKYIAGTLTPAEAKLRKENNIKADIIVGQLTEYGYPPVTDKSEVKSKE